MIHFDREQFKIDAESSNFTAQELAFKYGFKNKNKVYYHAKKLKIQLNIKKNINSYRTVEYKEKISKALKGIKRSPEQIENYKASAKKRGNNRPKGTYKHSEEVKEKIKKTNEKVWNELPQKWIDACLNNELWFKKLRKIDVEQLNDWEKYVYRVRRLSYKNAKIFSDLIEGEKQKGHHLDHIVSISEGFNNGLDIEIISHYTNLRYISAKENLTKNSRSDMSIEDLKKKYYDTKKQQR
jgi:ribosomal protein L34E